MERAAYYNEYGEKKLRGVLYTGSAAFGNAATNPRVRQQVLTGIQQMAHERLLFIPVMEMTFLNGVGPRAEVDGRST